MDNIVLEKVWQDDQLVEIKVTLNSEFVTAYQYCYTDERILRNMSKKIKK